MGFFISHIREGCRATDHPTLPLPYACPIDHYLFPRNLMRSPFGHRERGFLDNPRAAHINASRRVTVVPCVLAVCGADSGTLSLPRGASEAELVRRLGSVTAPVLHFNDIEAALGAFSSGQKSVAWHEEAQGLLDNYCCVADPVFRAKAGGGVPYLLPPLPGQRDWLGAEKLAWAREELARLFRQAGDETTAAELGGPTHGISTA